MIDSDSPPGPQWRAVATAIAGMAVCIAFGRFSLGLLLPDMRESMRFDYTTMGILTGLNLAGYLLGVWSIPRLARRAPHILLVRVGLLTASVGMVLTALPIGSVGLMSAVMLTGLAGAFGWVSSAAVALEASSVATRGRVMGLIGVANGAGIVAASLLAMSVADLGGIAGWRIVWIIQGAIGLIAVLLSAPPDGSSYVSPPPPTRASPRLAPILIGYGAFGVGYAWFTTYFVASAASAGTVNGGVAWLVVGIGACLGGFAFGAAGDRWGHLRALIASQLFAACSAALMVITPQFLFPTLLSGLLFGSALASMASLVPAALAAIVGEAAAPSSFAALTLVFALLQTFAPATGGLIVDHAPGSFTTLYAAATSAYFLAAAAFAWQRRATQAAA